MPPEERVDEIASDYRLSHLRRGRDYDERLGSDALDSYMANAEAQWLSRTIRALYPGGVPRYLDFACGTGRITEIAAPLARESVGIDVSRSMLDVAAQKCPQVRFIEADATREHPDIGSFDLVTAFRFFGNAQDELRSAALRAIVSLLRPGGHLIFNNHRNPYALSAILNRATGGADDMDLHYFKLRRLLRSNGIEPVEVRAIGFWLFRSRLFPKAEFDDSRLREQLFKGRAFAPLSPDALFVGRKA